jgi:hypothetical protein
MVQQGHGFLATMEDNDTKADLSHGIINEKGKVEALALGLTVVVASRYNLVAWFGVALDMGWLLH